MLGIESDGKIVAWNQRKFAHFAKNSDARRAIKLHNER